MLEPVFEDMKYFKCEDLYLHSMSAPSGPKIWGVCHEIARMLIDKNILSRLRKDVLLIDIASPPFGVDIGLADSYGINAVRALGLPGKYAPEEAGRLIFKKAQPLL